MKAKIITLKNNELSERVSKECIHQASKFGVDVEYFEAINGFRADEHLKILNVFRRKKIRVGALGCALSHITLWKQCLEDNEPYLILEHDGYFIEPLPENIFDKFEDVLKLDSSDPYNEFYEKNIEVNSKKDLEINSIPKNEKLKGQAGYYSKGAYAYIIKPTAAYKIINWIKENGFIRADHQLGTDICDIKVVNKTLVRLHPFYMNRIKLLSTTNNLEELHGNT